MKSGLENRDWPKLIGLLAGFTSVELIFLYYIRLVRVMQGAHIVGEKIFWYNGGPGQLLPWPKFPGLFPAVSEGNPRDVWYYGLVDSGILFLILSIVGIFVSIFFFKVVNLYIKKIFVESERNNKKLMIVIHFALIFVVLIGIRVIIVEIESFDAELFLYQYYLILYWIGFTFLFLYTSFSLFRKVSPMGVGLLLLTILLFPVVTGMTYEVLLTPHWYG